MVSSGSLAGLTVNADPSLRRQDDGRVLIGGSPLSVMRLSAAGASLVTRLLDGEPLPAGTSASHLLRRLLETGMMHPVPIAKPFALTDVTIVIPVHGSLHPELLDAIRGVAAIVVVDDASPEPIHVPAHNVHGVSTTVIRVRAQQGPAAARNAGSDRVATSITAFIDADCVPSDDWLEPLLGHFADPSVAVVAPRIVPTDPVDDQPTRLARYEHIRSALDLGSRPARVRARTRVSFVPSAALVVRTDIVRTHHGFAPSMDVGEDVDFVWRVDESGHTVRYEPAATVAHRHRTSFRPWAKRRFDYGTSAGPLARRHPGALTPLETSGWSVAVWALLATGHLVGAGAVFAGTAALLARKLESIDKPIPAALRLATAGHLGAGRLMAQSLVRPWWPITLLAAALVPSRKFRAVLLGTALAPAIIDWLRERPPLDPISYVAFRVADDVAYGAGVWVGAVTARTTEPLVPDLTSWPKPSRYSAMRSFTRGESLPPI
jgi:mycofactocin system glycosyltransferase